MVKFEEARPGQIEEEMGRAPVAFIPWGSLEWHGLHLPAGVDALKAWALCQEIAKRTGGVVLPPVYLGYHTMKPYKGFKRTVEARRETVQEVARDIFEQLADEGFKAVVVVMGHYGREHVEALKEVAEEFGRKHPEVKLLLFPDYEPVQEKLGVAGDHAGAYETSLMMRFFPHLVDLSQLPQGSLSVERDGIGGEDPRSASTEKGEEYAKVIVEWATERISALLGRTEG